MRPGNATSAARTNLSRFPTRLPERYFRREGAFPEAQSLSSMQSQLELFPVPPWEQFDKASHEKGRISDQCRGLVLLAEVFDANRLTISRGKPAPRKRQATEQYREATAT